MNTQLWYELDDKSTQNVSGGGVAQIDNGIDTGWGAKDVIDLEGVNGKIYAVSEDTNFWILDINDAAPVWKLIGTGVSAITVVNGDLYGALDDNRLLKVDL